MARQSSDNFEQSSKVLVRAFGGEAVAMICRLQMGGRVEVSRGDSVETLSLPEGMVFEFDPKIEQRVNLAVADGDEALVSWLWGEATPIREAQTQASLS